MGVEFAGVAIGSGWQGVVAYVNLVTYYVIGLPIGCVLGFKTSLGAAVRPFNQRLYIYCQVLNQIDTFEIAFNNEFSSIHIFLRRPCIHG